MASQSSKQTNAVLPQAVRRQERLSVSNMNAEPSWWRRRSDKSLKETSSSPDPCEGHSFSWESVYASLQESKDYFEAKYKQGVLLGRGVSGRVYEGYRRHDNMPVAIKRINQRLVKRSRQYLKPRNERIPLEVELMLRLKHAEGAPSAAVALLDWYDRSMELILVLERPVPCMDLRKYLISRGSRLHEDEVTVIVRQLVDALVEIHSKGVFHRDLMEGNVLIETGAEVPRVRLIDFGCATVATRERYRGRTVGSFFYRTPESFDRGWCSAEQATVWQLGVLVFVLLHGHYPFQDRLDITSPLLLTKLPLTDLCKDFIQRCLCQKPEGRANLQTLKQHDWLV